MRNVHFVFVLQEGYWELTTELGEFINVDVDLFANEFLKNKGIRSLGENCQNLFQAFRVEIYIYIYNIIKIEIIQWRQKRYI